jgi:hypothetical protein
MGKVPFFDLFRKNKPEREAEPKTALCFVLCRAKTPGDLSHASQVVSEVFGPGHSAEYDEKNFVTVARGGDVIGFLAHMPVPIPGGEAEDNADGNFMWPNGREEAAAHASHVVVMQKDDQARTPVQSALVLSKLALASLRIFDGLGVYWGNASVCNSRKVFEDFCEDISEQSLAVPVWLRFQLVGGSESAIGMYTLGMDQFGLMDIEVEQSKLNIQELFEFVANLAHYLILSGPIISDGSTVGGTPDEKILVRHRPSLIDKSRKVYSVQFGG